MYLPTYVCSYLLKKIWMWIIITYVRHISTTDDDTASGASRILFPRPRVQEHTGVPQAPDVQEDQGRRRAGERRFATDR